MPTPPAALPTLLRLALALALGLALVLGPAGAARAEPPRADPPPSGPPGQPAPAAAPANLVVVIPARVESPLGPGAVVPVPYALENEGGTATPAFHVTLHLVHATGERLLDEEPVPSLPPNGQRRGRLRAEIPADAPAGPARLRVRVDARDEVAESSEADNVVEAPILVERRAPNLVVEQVEARPHRVAPGEAVTIAAKVRNRGAGAAPPSQLEASLVRTNGPPVRLGELEVPALEPGAAASVEASVRVPEGTPALRWGLVARADAPNAIDEEDEHDNAAVVPGGLVTSEPAVAGMNLAVREVTRAEGHEVLPGEPLLVRARVASLGAAPAPAFDLALVLARRDRPERRKGAWRGVVAELARVVVPAGLGPGEEVVRDVEARMPTDLPPGPYVLVVVADPGARLDDVARDDDMGSLPIRLAGRALLRADAAGLALDRERAAAGEAIGVTARLRNEGNQASEPAALELALVGAAPRRRPGVDATLSSVPLDAVRPGGRRELALSGALPARLPAGRHRITLRLVPPQGAPVELASAWLAVGPTLGGLDLAVLEVVPARTEVRAGEGLRVEALVRNVGEGRAPATDLRVHLAQGALLRSIGDAPVPSLAPGEAVRVAVATRVPRESREGALWLQARVDPDGRLAQASRGDDEAWAPLTVAGRWAKEVRAQLETPRVTTAAPHAPGDPLDVRTRLREVAGAPLARSDVEAVLVAPHGAPRSLGRRAISGEAATGASEWAERFMLPEDLAPGLYVLRLLLDPDRLLPWATELASPPLAEVPLEVRGTARGTNLRAALLAVTSTTPERLGVEAVVRNEGPATAGAFDVTLGLTPGEPGRGAPWLPLEVRRIAAGALARDAQLALAFDVVRPEELPAGDYRVVLVVDPSGAADGVERDDNRLEMPLRWADGAAEPAPATAPSAPPTGPTPPPAPTSATPALEGLPIALAALLPGNELGRDGSEALSVLLSFPGGYEGEAIVEVALEVGTASWPLTELDVPAGLAGGTGVVKGRVRLPSAVPAGPATLLLTVRVEGGGGRAPLRMAVTVR